MLIISRLMRVVMGAAFTMVLVSGYLVLLRQVSGPYVAGFAVVGGVLAIPALTGSWLCRRLSLSWRQIVGSALLAGVVMALTIGLILPGYGMHFGTYPGVLRDQLQRVLLYTLVASAGVFVLPLADSQVRRAGPAPRAGRIILQALVITAILVSLEVVSVARWGGFGYSFFGLGTLAGGAGAAVGLIGLGVVFALAGSVERGAILGGIGLAVMAAAALVWLAAGARWFP